MQLALEIAKLELKSRDELQALWREYFKTDCNVQSREFYIARLAHRMQELAYGGLSTPKKEMIAQIGVGIKKKTPPILSCLCSSFCEKNTRNNPQIIWWILARIMTKWASAKREPKARHKMCPAC